MYSVRAREVCGGQDGNPLVKHHVQLNLGQLTSLHVLQVLDVFVSAVKRVSLLSVHRLPMNRSLLTSRSPSIDTLIRIPNDRDATMSITEQLHQLVLSRVCILKLVNQDMFAVV